MADDKLKYDKLQQVEEALKKSSVDSESKSTRLVTVAVVQAWNPPSLYLAKEIEKIRKSGSVKSPIFLIDADADPSRPEGSVVSATPALQFFLAGTPLTIRRTGWADDDKFAGSCSSANMTELFQCARSTENDGGRIMHVDF